MHKQPTAPPAYMWDRIEKILDEQDGRKRTEKLFLNDSSVSTKRNKQINLFIASITGMNLLLLIFLRYSSGLKTY